MANGREFPHMTGCEELKPSVCSHCRTVRSLISRPRTTDVIVAVRPYIGLPNSAAEFVADGQGDPARPAVMLAL